MKKIETLLWSMLLTVFSTQTVFADSFTSAAEVFIFAILGIKEVIIGSRGDIHGLSYSGHSAIRDCHSWVSFLFSLNTCFTKGWT